VTATLMVGGVQRQTRSWAGSQFPAGVEQQVVMDFDGLEFLTGVYGYVLEVTSWYGGVPYPSQVQGEIAVVNRSNSTFGAGWWLAGWERLYILDNYTRLLRVGGDGSTRVYTIAGSWGTWTAPALDRPDTITYSQTAEYTGYTRKLAGGAKVLYNGAGGHEHTVDRLGRRTTFMNDGNTLALNVLMVPAPTRSWTYDYAYVFSYGGAGGRLSAITQHAGSITRTVQVACCTAVGQLTAITDPDAQTTYLGTYANGGPTRLITEVQRPGVTTVLVTYDAGQKLREMRRPMQGTAPDIVTTLVPQETRGMGGPPLPMDSVYTRLDGPRTDVVDVTRFWVDRWGRPWKTQDALGHVALAWRADARFPALVTQTQAPNGLVSRAWYNARGNVDSTRVENPLGDGRNATSRYEYGEAAWPDFATRITLPQGEVTQIGYDATTGLRLWQQPGTDATRRVNFAYRPLTDPVVPNMPASTTHPAGAGQSGPTVETYEYDGLGNLNAVQSPLGIRGESYADALGRDTVQRQQITATTWEVIRHLYDAVDQDTLTETIGPAMNGQPEQHLVVRTRRNAAGDVLSVRRESLPDPAHLDSVVTRFAYDAAGRMVRETAPDGQPDTTVYDPAGNPTWSRTRRGDTIRTRYDALNRPLVSYHSAALYAAERRGIPSTTSFGRVWCPDSTTGYSIYHPYPQYQNEPNCGYRVPADSAVFEYDAMGNLLRGDNADALVRRSYLPNGLLERETLKVQTAARNDTTAHVYALVYGYDLDGRRTTLTHPAALAPAGGAPTRYAYHSVTGALETVTDPLGNVFRYGYDNGGQIASLQRGQYVLDGYLYDDDGRVRQYNLDVPPALGGRMSQTTITYDRRGKRLLSHNAVGCRTSWKPPTRGSGTW
jgi:YD repeat-containing protein